MSRLSQLDFTRWKYCRSCIEGVFGALYPTPLGIPLKTAIIVIIIIIIIIIINKSAGDDRKSEKAEAFLSLSPPPLPFLPSLPTTQRGLYGG